MPSDRPHIVVNVGAAHKAAYKTADAGHVVSAGRKIKTLKPGGRDVIGVPDDRTMVSIDTTGIADVWIYNRSTVQLTLTTRDSGDELDDVLGINKTFKIPPGARTTVRT